MFRKTNNCVFYILIGAAPLACSAQAEPDYRGEPLALMRGTVSTGDNQLNQNLDAVLLWLGDSSNNMFERAGGLPVARVSVTGDFPASFQMEVLDPPPPPSDPSSVTDYGIIAALPSDTTGPINTAMLAGVSTDAFVVYFMRNGDSENPDDPITQTAARYAISPTQGYHLVRMEVTTETEELSYTCQGQIGICQHHIALDVNVPGLNELHDDLFELCLRYTESPVTCNMYYSEEPLTAEQSAETEQCSALYQEHEQAFAELPFEQRDCPLPWRYPGDTEGFERPVMVRLGATFLDFMIPRSQED